MLTLIRVFRAIRTIGRLAFTLVLTPLLLLYGWRPVNWSAMVRAAATDDDFSDGGLRRYESPVKLGPHSPVYPAHVLSLVAIPLGFWLLPVYWALVAAVVLIALIRSTDAGDIPEQVILGVVAGISLLVRGFLTSWMAGVVALVAVAASVLIFVAWVRYATSQDTA